MNHKTHVLFQAALEELEAEILHAMKSQGRAGKVPCEYGLQEFESKVEFYWVVFRQLGLGGEGPVLVAEECAMTAPEVG